MEVGPLQSRPLLCHYYGIPPRVCVCTSWPGLKWVEHGPICSIWDAGGHFPQRLGFSWDDREFYNSLKSQVSLLLISKSTGQLGHPYLIRCLGVDSCLGHADDTQPPISTKNMPDARLTCVGVLEKSRLCRDTWITAI